MLTKVIVGEVHRDIELVERVDEMGVVEGEDVVQVLPPDPGRGAGGQQVVEVQGGTHVATELEVDVEDTAILTVRIPFDWIINRLYFANLEQDIVEPRVTVANGLQLELLFIVNLHCHGRNVSVTRYNSIEGRHVPSPRILLIQAQQSFSLILVSRISELSQEALPVSKVILEFPEVNRQVSRSLTETTLRKQRTLTRTIS